MLSKLFRLSVLVIAFLSGVHFEVLASKATQLVGYKATVALKDSEKGFCEALRGRTIAYRQTFRGRIELLVPADNQEQAELFLSLRYALPVKEQFVGTWDVVNVEGCPVVEESKE